MHSAISAPSCRPAISLLRPAILACFKFVRNPVRVRGLALKPLAAQSIHSVATDPQLVQRNKMLCPDQPRFHVAPPGGWINDPNGPLFYKGWWHMFYQYLPGSAKWDWGLQWGHAVSRDNVHWQHLPAALLPTPAGMDQDGVFSGCACIDEETGVPVLLYTGVRLRSSPTCGPLPPAPFDLNLPFIESQLVAWPADPDDPMLRDWVKGDVPILSLPPPNMDLAGWRDPYIIATPSTSPDGTYKLVLGSGVKGKGGLVMVYKSKHLRHGWEFDKFMCVGKYEGPTDITGIMWEMPLLAKLPDSQSPPPVCSELKRPSEADQTAAPAAADDSNPHVQPLQPATTTSSTTLAQLPADGASQVQHNRHFFSISPDACTSPTLYWLGNCSSCDTFDIHNADGPYKLDLGDILYAPNIVKDPQGRVLLVAWQQERRKVGEYTYAGCMSTPRVLTVDASDPAHPRLLQQPLPELANLRVPGRRFLLGAATPGAEQPHVEVDTDDFTAQQLKRGASQGPLEDVGWQEAGRAQRHAAMMMEDEYAEGPTARQEHRKSTQASAPPSPSPAATAADGAPDVGSPQQPVPPHNGSVAAVITDGSQATDLIQGKGRPAPGSKMLVGAGQSVTIPGVSGPFLDIEIALMPANPADGLLRPRPAVQTPALGPGSTTAQQEEELLGTAVATVLEPEPEVATGDVSPAAGDTGLMSGLALRSWVSGGSAAVLYNWREGTLEVVYEATEPGTHKFSLAAPDVRRVGGVLRRPPAAGEPLRLRLLLDGSLLEIFTGEGEALSTRVYRGVPQEGEHAGAVCDVNLHISTSGIDLISVGGDTVVRHLEVHEVAPAWVDNLAPARPVPESRSVEELLAAAMKL